MIIMFIDDGNGTLWRARFNGVQKRITLETDGALICTNIKANTVPDALNQLRENMATLFD